MRCFQSFSSTATQLKLAFELPQISLGNGLLRNPMATLVVTGIWRRLVTEVIAPQIVLADTERVEIS